MRQMERIMCVLPAVLLWAVSLPAQEQPSFRDSVEVRVINLDVVVEDAAGKPVTGLSPSDFEILENGKVQPITNFAEYQSGTFVEPPEDAPAATQYVRPAETRQPRTIVFLIDAFNQTPNVREELFTRIREFTRDGLEPGDRAALFNWRKSIMTVVPLTTDLRLIDRALSQMGGMQLPAEDQAMDGIVQFLEEADAFEQGLGDAGASSLAAQMETTIRHCAEEYLSEMEGKSIALRSMIDSLAGIEGRKILVYVAGRFPADTATYCQSILRTPALGPANFTFRAGTFSTDRLVDKVTDAANAAGVTFYPIRPRTSARRTTAVEYTTESSTGASEELGDTLVMMNDADALATLAEKTGGRLAVGDHLIDELLPSILSDLDNYYSLGYRATSDGGDRQRDLTVRMKNRSLRARARDAFVEKSRLSEIKDQLIANLFGEPRKGDIELDVIVGEPVPGRRGRSTLPVEVRIPLDQLIYEGQTPVSEVRLLSAAGTTPGSTTEISETVKRIEKPPADLDAPFITWKVDLVLPEGGTKVAFGVLDEVSGLVGFVTVDRTTESIERAEAAALAGLSEWERVLEKGHRKGKPLLVYFRPEPCYRREGFNKIPICDQFESDVLSHPEIAQRLQSFELIRWTPGVGLADWPKDRAGLALMRIDGQPIVQWTDLLDGANLARVLDTLIPHAREFVRINELTRLHRIDEADLATAMLKIRFGLRREAIETLERLKRENPEFREISSVRLAYLDAAENRGRGLRELHTLIPKLSDPTAVGEGWLAVAALTSGEEKLQALRSALEISPDGSSQKIIAQSELDALVAPEPDQSVIQVAPVPIASGRTEIRTVVRSSKVDSVEFVLDGRSIAKDEAAPFRASVDLERLPARHDLKVIARDPRGSVIGEDVLVLNGNSDSLWVRFIAPELDQASGETPVELVLQVPQNQMLRSVKIDHDGDVIALEGPPYRTNVTIDPAAGISVLQATVTLENGETAGDTKILNGAGLAETTGVHLVEIPLVPMGNQTPRLDQIRLFESGQAREIEALIGSDEAPLTLGLVIDTSTSMNDRILDVQSAAVTFVEQVLRPQDRGFLISFDSEPHLDVQPTADQPRLVRGIRALSPGGKTALFDAMMLGLLQYETLGGRRAMVVFSDGEDSISRYKLEDISEVARRTGIPIYLVRAWSEEERERLAPQNVPTFRSSSTNTVLQRQQQQRLEHLSRETGGTFFDLSSLSAIDEVFAEIGRLVRRQVLLTYLTETSPNQEWRPIEVRVEGRAEVKAPQGYYARPN